MLDKINLGIAQKQRRFKTLSHFATENLDWFASNLFIDSDIKKDKTSRSKGLKFNHIKLIALSNLKLAIKACALILNLTQIYIPSAKKIIYLKFNTTHKIKFKRYF